jgi:PmbA protein
MAKVKAGRERVANLVARHSDKRFEAYWESSRSVRMNAMKGELSSFTVSATEGLAARVLKDRKMGFAFTENLEEAELERAIRRADENAGHIADDEGNCLFESNESFDSDAFYNPQLVSLPVEKKRDMVLGLEKVAFERDRRVVNVPYCFYGESSHRLLVANSFGLLKSSSQSFCYSYLYVMAREGEETTIGSWGMGADRFEDLDRERIAGNAVSEALDQLAAGEVKSGRYPVLLKQDVASDLLECFFGRDSPFYGESVQLGISRLAGKLGDEIAAGIVTVVDDPYAPGIGRREFDGEGVPSKKMPIIEAGRLVNFFYSLYAARREGKEPTGHGNRGSYKSDIKTAPSNVILKNGGKSEAELIAQIPKGIYVSQVEGLHASVNPVSGDFSAGAKGTMIENGALGRPLKNFTIAGNFFDMLMRIADLADNRRSDSFNRATSPSLLLEEIDVSGR